MRSGLTMALGHFILLRDIGCIHSIETIGYGQISLLKEKRLEQQAEVGRSSRSVDTPGRIGYSTLRCRQSTASSLVHKAYCVTMPGHTDQATRRISGVWPKHHPFPKYLGGAADQTLRKIPRKLHERFHAALDLWKGGKYARWKRGEHFKHMNRNSIISDLREFYLTAEGGVFRKYVGDFERAVFESLEGSTR